MGELAMMTCGFIILYQTLHIQHEAFCFKIWYGRFFALACHMKHESRCLKIRHRRCFVSTSCRIQHGSCLQNWTWQILCFGACHILHEPHCLKIWHGRCFALAECHIRHETCCHEIGHGSCLVFRPSRSQKWLWWRSFQIQKSLTGSFTLTIVSPMVLQLKLFVAIFIQNLWCVIQITIASGDDELFHYSSPV